MKFAEIKELYKNNSGRGKEYYKSIFKKCIEILERLERRDVKSVIRFGMLPNGDIGMYGARGHSGTMYIYKSTIEIDLEKETIKFKLSETDTKYNLKKIFGENLLDYTPESFTISIKSFE